MLEYGRVFARRCVIFSGDRGKAHIVHEEDTLSMSGNVVRAAFAQPEFEVNVLISELIGFNVDLDLFPFACGVDIFSFEINGRVRSAVGKLYRHAF